MFLIQNLKPVRLAQPGGFKIQNSFWLFLLFQTAAFSQPASKMVRGRITDASQKPVPSASASLIDPSDSSVIKLVVAGKDGFYQFDYIAIGKYIISVTAIGYKDNRSIQTLTDTSRLITLNFIMSPENRQLQDVTVISRKPLVQVRPDKIILHVAESINATGTSAFELLRKAPGFRIINEEALVLNGKSGVVVYLDGNKVNLDGKDLVEYLQSFTSANIESIEIITHPSAKYDAAGNAGIVNIRTKKNSNLGFNSNLSAAAGFSNYKPKYDGAVNVNYRKKKFNLYANYSLFHADYKMTMSFLRRQLNVNNIPNVYDQDYTSLFVRNTNNWKAGVDFFFGKNSTIGIVTDGQVSTNKPVRTSITNIYTDPAKIDSQLVSATTQPKKNLTGNYGVNYRYKDSTGRALVIQADYGNYDIRSDGYLYNSYINKSGGLLTRHDYQVYSKTGITIASARADYSQKLFKGELGLGLKYSKVNSDNDLAQYNMLANQLQLDTGKTNRFVYKERIAAAYINYNLTLSKWEFQLGLRAEHTQTDGRLTTVTNSGLKAVDTSYINLFPNIVVSCKVSDSHTLGMAYNRRVDRPAYASLNPFKFVLDDLYYIEGNPFLRPQFTSEISLSYGFKEMMNASLSYSNSRDNMINFRDTITGGKTFQTSINGGSQKILNLDLSARWPIRKYWDADYGISAYHEEVQARLGRNNATLSQNAWSLYTTNTFKLRKKCTIELSAYYNSSVMDAPAILHAQWSADIGFQKRIWDDAASIRCSLSDIFNTLSNYYTRDFGGLYFTNRNKWETCVLKIAFSYKLGNRKLKDAALKNSGAVEERKRVGN